MQQKWHSFKICRSNIDYQEDSYINNLNYIKTIFQTLYLKQVLTEERSEKKISKILYLKFLNNIPIKTNIK